MSETRPLCFSCGFAEGLHVHEVRDDGEECVAWPDMDDLNAGFAALRSEVAALREALRSLARIETDEEGLPVLVISCGWHCQTSDQTELPLVWAALSHPAPPAADEVWEPTKEVPNAADG